MPRPRRVAIMLDLDWPYKRHAGVFAGSQQYAQEQGWESIIDEYVDDTLTIRLGQPVPYDGVIARATKKLAHRAAQVNVPVVNVWHSSPAYTKLPGVYADLESAGRMRAEHLLARGFRRFAAWICSDDRGQSAELKAFAATVEEVGFSCASVETPLESYSTLKNWRKTERAMAAWMKDWELPIGVYAGNEKNGRMVIQMCRNRGWRVPEDVAVIAGWNEETLCEYLRPTMSSVEVGYERIGYEAARMLDRMMDGKAPPKEPLLTPIQGLVVRESTDFFAVDDELIAAALGFIAANSHLQIGPEDVARAVTTETRTLQRRFRKYLDRPIATEIRRVRIERAKRELEQSKRPLARIARDVGFGEAMRMYEVFRRELGITPSAYRRERQSAG